MPNTTSLKGRRLPDNTDWSSDIRPGDYFKSGERWFASLPNGDFADITNWNIQENPNGTITASPSIQTLPSDDPNSWHGFLTDGEFKSC